MPGDDHDQPERFGLPELPDLPDLPAARPRDASWDDVVRDLRRPASTGDAAGAPRGRHRRAAPAPPPADREPVLVEPVRRGRRRRRVLIALGVLAVGGAVVVLTVPAPEADSAGAARSVAAVPSVAPSVSPSAAALPATWFDVVARLDAERTRIWTSGRASQLGAVDVAGSAAERADRDVLDALRADGVRPAGLVTRVDEVGVMSKRPGRVTLRVVDRRSAYELRSPDGAVQRSVPARGPKAWHVDVVLVGEHWLVDRTTAA